MPKHAVFPWQYLRPFTHGSHKVSIGHFYRPDATRRGRRPIHGRNLLTCKAVFAVCDIGLVFASA